MIHRGRLYVWTAVALRGLKCHRCTPEGTASNSTPSYTMGASERSISGVYYLQICSPEQCAAAAAAAVDVHVDAAMQQTSFAV